MSRTRRHPSAGVRTAPKLNSRIVDIINLFDSDGDEAEDGDGNKSCQRSISTANSGNPLKQFSASPGSEAAPVIVGHGATFIQRLMKLTISIEGKRVYQTAPRPLPRNSPTKAKEKARL
jgi:hypothetical protein